MRHESQVIRHKSIKLFPDLDRHHRFSIIPYSHSLTHSYGRSVSNVKCITPMWRQRRRHSIRAALPEYPEVSATDF